MRRSARDLGDASFNDIVRRIVNFPRTIIREVSHVMNQGIDSMRIGQSPNQNHPPNYPLQQPSNYPSHENHTIQEEWSFLTNFEQQYGTMHPFFYACKFKDALKIAQDEHKLVLVYIHSLDHPFTPSFCRETLCSEFIVQFVDANFVSWGGIANTGEGFQMATTLRASSFPFCAVVAPVIGDDIAVLQQIEGPVTPDELFEILQRTIEEQGLAFGSGRVKQEENKRLDRRLRNEQDDAYIEALKKDQEKERMKNASTSQTRVKEHEKTKQNSTSQQSTKADKSGGKRAEVTQILIRFPNGERREHSFMSTDKIQAIYRYIDSLGLQGIGNYRIISNFPRKVYGTDQMKMTIKDSGLHPKASIFLELMD